MTGIVVIFFMYNIEGKMDSVWQKCVSLLKRYDICCKITKNIVSKC